MHPKDEAFSNCLNMYFLKGFFLIPFFYAKMTSNEQITTIPSPQHYGNFRYRSFALHVSQCLSPEQRKIRGIVLTMERQAFLPSGSLLRRGKTTCAIVSLPSGWCLKLHGDPVSAVERLILLNAWEL